ncbi:MAG: phosphatase PAP2 family protein [Gammaproteobacteria bacterium]
MVDYLDQFELHLCLRVNALSRRELVRRFFSIVSWSGNYPAWLLLGIAVAIQQGTSAVRFAVVAIATGLAGVLVYKALKERLVRERPFVTHGEIVCGTAPMDRYSFPSGHTLHAVSLTMLYGAFEPSMLVVMVPYAVLVAISRIILGLHYPSDVLAGGLIGALLASVSLRLAV